MTATKVISDRFKVPSLWATRLREHQVSVPDVLRRAGLPVSFFQQEKIYVNLLKVDGNLTLVGAPEKPHAVSAFALLLGRRSLSGSPIGGIVETQEMLDFCGKNNIAADVEVIPIQKINEAYDRMAKSDVKYRFSIDMASLKAE